MSNMPPDQPTEPSATPPARLRRHRSAVTGHVVGGSISGGTPRTQINVSDIARLPMPGQRRVRAVAVPGDRLLDHLGGSATASTPAHW